MDAADLAARASDDRVRDGSLSRNRRSEEIIHGICRAQIRYAIARRLACRRRRLRRERRVSHLRRGGGDFFSPRFPLPRPARPKERPWFFWFFVCERKKK